MSNLISIGMIVLIFMVLILMSFAVFSIGFLIGYKNEERKIGRKKQQLNNNKTEETNEEKKAKKEWKKFLEYDGSTPTSADI